MSGTAMELRVDRLDATPTVFEYEGGASWWSKRESSEPEGVYTLLEPFRFSVSAHAMALNVYLEGEMTGAIEVECSRCLARYRHELRDSFRLVLEPVEDRIPPDPEGAAALARTGMCLGDDLEVGWYRGSRIRLSDFFGEVVALGWPVSPVCKETCRGLCARCGIDRNEASCLCEDEKRESPFAALAALRGGSKSSSH